MGRSIFCFWAAISIIIYIDSTMVKAKLMAYLVSDYQ